MKILEFGDDSKRKIILIHGFQCPWQVWNKYIEYYKDKFHIIVPIMSGHNPEVKDDFISFISDAKEIEDKCIRIINLYHEKEDFMWHLFGVDTTPQETIDYWNE